MDRGPLPPHERSWRHPSELAEMESAEVRADPGSRALRVAALTTGTLGLLAVGVLAIMVTPSRGDSPLAVQSSPSLVDPSLLAPLTTALLDRAAAELTGAFGVSRAERDRTTVATFASATTAVARPAAEPTTPLATLLDSGFALVTVKSLAGYSAGDPLAVRLASGRTFDAEVLATGGHAALVALGALIGDEPGHEVADQMPADDAMVTVLASPPHSVRLAELASTGAPEGTAVVDSAGRLIGLCTRDDAGRTSLAPAIDAAAPGTEPTSTVAHAPTITPAITPTITATTTPATATTTSLPAVATSTTSPGTSTTSTSTSTTSTTGPSTSTTSTIPWSSTTVAHVQR